jgi:hypothetical protein
MSFKLPSSLTLALPDSGPVWPPPDFLAKAGAKVQICNDAEALDALLAATCDAALLAPQYLLDAPAIRIVPGIGILLAQESGLPEVLRVWACRYRAPYPAIRATLAMAHQAAEACISSAAPHGYSHVLASAGAESLQQLARSLRPDSCDQLFHFC